MNRYYGSRCLFLTTVLLFSSVSLFAATTSIDFEGLGDGTFLTGQYPGVTFSNAVVLSSGISLNELDFPPRSGINVASDVGGPASLVFSTPVQNFSGYFTYVVPITLQAFDSANNLLAASKSLFSINTVFGGPFGSNPNELIQVSAPAGFSKVVITGDPAGSSFVLDDAAFGSGQPNQIPEPSLAVLTGLAALVAARARRRA